MPKVSICIPVYNYEQCLAETIQGVLAQTFVDWELIVIDDRSQDRSVEVARSFGDPRMRVVVNEANLGVEGNWNRALRECRGEYIKLLCADDVIYPDCIAQQAAVLDAPANRHVVLVSSRRDIVNARGEIRLRGWGHQGLPAGLVAGVGLIRHCVKRGTNPIGEPSICLFRRSAAQQAGDFNARFPYLIDLDYWFRLLETGDFYALPETHGTFRIWPGSWSTRLVNQQRDQAIAFFHDWAESHPGQVTRLDLLQSDLRCRVTTRLRVLANRWINRGM